MALPPEAYGAVPWWEGTNSELFSALRVRPAHRDTIGTEMRPEEWLLIEWPDGEPGRPNIPLYRPSRGHT